MFFINRTGAVGINFRLIVWIRGCFPYDSFWIIRVEFVFILDYSYNFKILQFSFFVLVRIQSLNERNHKESGSVHLILIKLEELLHFLFVVSFRIKSFEVLFLLIVGLQVFDPDNLYFESVLHDVVDVPDIKIIDALLIPMEQGVVEYALQATIDQFFISLLILEDFCRK